MYRRRNRSSDSLYVADLMIKKIMHIIPLLLFILAGVVLLVSFYLQFVLNVEPCPLCIMQRFIVFLLTVLSYVHWRYPYLKFTLELLMVKLFVVLLGLFFSGRQIYLQVFADSFTGVCMPGLAEVLSYVSWGTLLKILFWGSADCSDASLTFLYLTIAQWTFLYFLAVFLISLLLIFHHRSKR